jgi:hypothetical protein
MRDCRSGGLRHPGGGQFISPCGVKLVLAAYGLTSSAILGCHWSAKAPVICATKAEALGPQLWSTLQAAETSSAEYQAAYRAYEVAYVCRSQAVTPACLALSYASTSPSIARAMTGSANPFEV